MTDKRLGLIDALKESWAMAMAQPVSDHIIVVILFLVLTSLGSSLPFAVLITQPIAIFVLLGAYLERGNDAADISVSTPPPPPPPAD
jgi:predicted RND superfamily exporter protein